MKREVTRAKKLPAFSLDLGSLEALCTRVSALFDSSEEVSVTIKVPLRAESLEFASVHELRECTELPGRVAKFTLFFWQRGHHVSVWPGDFPSFRPVVRASADAEAWCAGAVETIYSFARSNKLWYSWFVTAPTGLILIGFVYASAIVAQLLPKTKHIGLSITIPWLVVAFVITLLFIAKSFLLPSMLLVHKQSDTFIQRHAAELTLVVSILALIITVVGWFLHK